MTDSGEKGKFPKKRPDESISSGRSGLSYVSQLAIDLFFDDEIVVHAEHAENASRQNVHQVVIAAIGNVAFKRHVTAVNNQSDRRIRLPQIAIQAAAVGKFAD